MERNAIIIENKGAFSSSKSYCSSAADGNELTISISSSSKEPGSDSTGKSEKTGQQGGGIFFGSFLLTLRQIFLPSGYPSSVSPDYVEYQIYDTLQAFASSINNSIALEQVMKSVGVGNAGASAGAAAMTWLYKTGSGMISQIIFAWYKGTSLDYDCKKWRIFADLLNDFGTLIDLIAPLFPSKMIILIFCISSISRSLVGVAGGATRSAITQHQARLNNMADVSAKDSSQETLVNLLALIVSLVILPLISGNTTVAWILFCFLTILHLFANYKAVKSLRFETLNIARLLICLKSYLNHKNTLPSIKDVNLSENVLVGFGIKDRDICDYKVTFGDTLENSLEIMNNQVSELISIIKKSEGKPYLIITNQKLKRTCVILHENINSTQIIEAYCMAIFTSHFYSTNTKITEKDLNLLINNQWIEFKRLLVANGFVIDRALIASSEWRAKWKLD